MPVDAALEQEINAKLSPLGWEERLRALIAWPGLHAAFSTSLGFEDQAITHAIADSKLPIRIFTLDTGRLFEETYALHQATQDRYGVEIETYFPDAAAVKNLVRERGINGFYHSVENRKTCCYVRKVEPLARALKGVELWISGLRREQSDNRADLPVAEWDAAHGLVKLYPLADVSADTLWKYIETHQVPVNPLHRQGFPSIGCAPCTRAIQPGEDFRAGRWWWEQEDKKECGLHMVDGKLVRVNEGNGNA